MPNKCNNKLNNIETLKLHKYKWIKFKIHSLENVSCKVGKQSKVHKLLISDKRLISIFKASISNNLVLKIHICDNVGCGLALIRIINLTIIKFQPKTFNESL